MTSSHNFNLNNKNKESLPVDEQDTKPNQTKQNEIEQNEIEQIEEQLRQQTKQKLADFNAQFAELMSRDSFDGRLVFAFTRRLLMQFRLKGTYSEAYVINEAYIRGAKIINKGDTIRKFSSWLRGTIYNIVRELSRGRIRDSSDEFNEEIDQQLQSSLIADENLNYELELIRLAYEMLDANDKQLLNLKVVERNTWNEIREILIAKGGKVPSVSALRKRKERALANLRKLYHEVKESSNMTTIN